MSATPRSRIYMDHAATTPMDSRVREAMQPYLDDVFGNPSSLHYFGKQARKALEEARKGIADSLGAQPEELAFTSGATEADNLAIFGIAETLQDKGRHLVVSSIEHPAIYNACEYLKFKDWDITYLPVDGEGFISPEAVEEALRPDTMLVSIIHGNNEIGTIQPIAEIGAMLRERGVLFHTDAVQTVGKLPFDLKTLPVDYLSLSGHKIYGPKGIGALYIRSGAPKPVPMLHGGGQEGNLRSGTENLAAVVGLAKALKIANETMTSETARQRNLQKRLITGIEAAVPGAELNGPRDIEKRVPGNVHFSFPPGEGESLVLHLDLKGIAVSSGSACHSAVIEPSRIVMALGKSEAIARATIRFSMGRNTTEADVDAVIAALPGIVKRFVKSDAKAPA